MKLAVAIFLCVVSVLFSSAWAQKKPKEAVIPGLILHARYVYVTSFTGDQFDVRTMPENRAAIADVIDALKKWGRYAVTYEEKNADLIMAVRAGRIAAAKVGGGVDTGTSGTRTFGTGGVEVGSPDDTLLVMQAGGNHALDAPSLWRGSARNGLQGPDPALVAAFKKDVERAAAKKP